MIWLENFLRGRKHTISVNGSKSSWGDVESGIPQGTILGPILFILYINDLPNKIKSYMKIFADDTKLYSKVDTIREVEEIKNDLEHIEQWSRDWLIKPNPSKCSVMHIGKNNPSVDYKLNGRNIKETKIEKDLGVYVQDNLKFERQINNSVRKANNMIRIIKHTFTYLDSKSLSILYKTYIRPHLEYCVQAWSSYLHKDVDKLESVQRSVTKIMLNFKNLPYHQRLAELGLTTLQERRVRGDLIEVYQIVEGIDDISVNFIKID